jgi:predicted GH43/DUF377 family glycosyl hydrolase
MIWRSEENPILLPVRENSWEAYATLNPSVIQRAGRYYMLYRAISSSDLLKKQGSSFSSIGIAISKDGVHFTDRQCFICPEMDWERYGCEDPRVTYIDGKYYIFYTAISVLPPKPEGIRVGLAVSSNLETVDGKYLVTPFNAKAMALFPKRINGKLTAILTVHTDCPPAYICIAHLGDDPSVWYTEMDEWHRKFMNYVLKPDPRRSPKDHIEVGAPPIEVEEGWLLIYSYIQNYFSELPEERVFGVEALLLDRNDPSKVIAKTHYPFMVPEEVYEVYGHVPKVIFPSSAIKHRDWIRLYYGAADTVCCLATARLSHIKRILKSGLKSVFKRHAKNPIISPDKRFSWRCLATFNPAAIELEGNIYILFRALSYDKTSSIGLAVTSDGFTIREILDTPIYVPRKPFEMKLMPGHSGCEDPRAVKIGDKIYMFYTAYDNVNPPKVAVTSITINDFLNRNWKWSCPKIISPPGVDDKDACVLPEPIKGKYFYIHRVGGVNIAYDYLDSLEAVDPSTLVSRILFSPRTGMWDGKKIGLAAPPIKTEKGWLMLYHGVSHDNFYHVGAALLDIQQPERVIARTTTTLLSPEASYEREGYVKNVVFPCGAINRDNRILLYYGAADTHVCVATATINEIFAEL